MGLSKRLAIVCLCFTFLFSFSAIGQSADKTGTSKTELTLAAREIMKEAGTCALITLDAESLPMVRTMDPFLPEEDFTIWFGTNKHSRKVKEIQNNPIVTLYYKENDDNGYVVIHGKAEIVNDAKEKQKRWKAAWEEFYPNNREAYTLIKVIPDWMEILSVSRNIMGDSLTWKTPVVKFN